MDAASRTIRLVIAIAISLLSLGALAVPALARPTTEVLFRGADGNFSIDAFRAAVRQRGFTEAAVREDLGASLIARQMLLPVTFSPVVPASFGQRYASLLRETREGTIALLPSAVFAPARAPTNAQLQAFYRANTTDYIRPERRAMVAGLLIRGTCWVLGLLAALSILRLAVVAA